MRQKEPPRVRGPYKERRGWRLVVFEEAGRRSLHFSTEAEALRRKAALARELERTAPRTIATMLDEYVEHKIETGRSLPYIAQAERRRLVALLGPFVEQDIGSVTPARAAARPSAAAPELLWMNSLRSIEGLLVFQLANCRDRQPGVRRA